MIKFEKVSYNEYRKSILNIDPNCTKEQIKQEYENIKLPKRATVDSAGYDFYAPFNLALHAPQMEGTCQKNIYTTFPTGIRFVTDRNDIFLMCVPRSGLGFKYQVRLANTTGIIDAGYCRSDNEGHIMVKMTAEQTVYVEAGKAFMQGIILPFIKTDDDDATSIRNGGFGSTGA